MVSSCDALVVGAGGFLGGHLVRSLLLQGLTVRAVDVKPRESWSQCHPEAENRTADVAVLESALAAASGATTVYDLAAAPSGSGGADRMSAVLLDTHLLLAARETGVDRFLLASSATEVPAALAATAPDDRCWRHLFTERMARHFFEDFGVQTRVARLGPVYGDHGRDGDDAAVVTVVARLVAAAVATGSVEVDIPYGSDDVAAGVFVDDAVLGLQLITHGTDDSRPRDVVDPAPRTVAEVVDAVVDAAGVTLAPRYLGTSATPGRVGDPTDLLATVDWQPDIALDVALPDFYAWTSADVRRDLDLPPSLTTRWAQRRALSLPPAPVRGVGRHRYENAG